jgi:hypothetical protein
VCCSRRWPEALPVRHSCVRTGDDEAQPRYRLSSPHFLCRAKKNLYKLHSPFCRRRTRCCDSEQADKNTKNTSNATGGPAPFFVHRPLFLFVVVRGGAEIPTGGREIRFGACCYSSPFLFPGALLSRVRIILKIKKKKSGRDCAVPGERRIVVGLVPCGDVRRLAEVLHCEL